MDSFLLCRSEKCQNYTNRILSPYDMEPKENIVILVMSQVLLPKTFVDI